MAGIIHSPTRIQAEGQPTKIIEEFFGRVNSGTSVAQGVGEHDPGRIVGLL
jgi:hypothetical protein